MTRALIAVRLSHLTDETTSPQRQEATCREYCDSRGMDVVGVASDLDISAGHMSPFDRPSIRAWLDRPEDYDVLVFWKMDRFLRRVWHFAQIVQWAEDYDRNVVSATESYIDLSTPMGRAISSMAVTFAEMEWEGISDRTSDAFRYNLREGKFRGGHPPFGYIPEKEGAEWRLVPWDETKPLLLGIIGRVLDGEKVNEICADLNDRGIMTPHDYFRVAQGKAPTGSKWRSSSLTRSLRSLTMLGHVVSRPVVGKKRGRKVFGKPEVLRNDDGTPLVRSEPLTDVPTYHKLQVELDSRSGQRDNSKKSDSLLLRVAQCGVCGLPFYKSSGKSYDYYRCASWSYPGKRSCGNGVVRLSEADELVENTLLSVVGDVERSIKVYVPGEDTATQLAEVDAELLDVAGLIGTGAFKAGPARGKLESRAEALGQRRDELASRTSRPSGYRFQPSGETFRQHWDKLDRKGCNAFLRNHGVRLVFTKGGSPEMDLTFGDLPDMIRSINPDLTVDFTKE